MSDQTALQSHELGQYTIGIVADSAAEQMQLRAVVDQLGQKVSYALTPDQALDSTPLSPSLWLVVSKDAADVFDALVEWSESPIFIAEDMPSSDDGLIFQQWSQRLQQKLSKALAAAPTAVESDQTAADVMQETWQEVWVLASSLGGPEAVRVFLQHLREALPVSFVYAQHIEENFDEMLPGVVGKHSSLEVTYCGPSEKLRKGVVTVIPSHNPIMVNAFGRIDYLLNQSWNKPYSPNIDQIIDNLAEHFHDRLGVIVFSGMCDDCAKAALAAKDKANIPLWAQAPEECICAAMPESVIASGQVDEVATAKVLAEKLNQRFFPATEF